MASGPPRPHPRWVGGVCVGIADRLRVDPLLIRALAVVLLFTGGSA